MKERAVIDKVYKHPKKGTTPTLLKFQNGKLGVVNRDVVQFSNLLLQTKGDKQIKGALVVAGNQTYLGEIANSETDQLTDNYICIRNKSTNMVRMIPIDQVMLKNSVYSKLEKKSLGKLSEENTKKMLLKQFGGRKASRYASNQQNMKVSIDMVKDELDTTVQEANFDDEGDQKLDNEQHLNAIRPHFNANATQLHEIYNISDIIPADLVERLEEEARAVMGTDVNKLPIKSDYLRSCVETLQKTTPSAEGIHKIKIIIYMDCLLNLIRSRARALRKMELSGISEKVENDIRDRFSDPVHKSWRTALTSEKALCYFIVLSLLISDNYQVDLSVLTKELGTARQKVIKFAQIVNARPKARTDILCLCLPSKVPKLSTFSGRKVKH